MSIKKGNSIQVSEQFIRDTYDTVCNEWKIKLDEQFPQLNLFQGIFKKGKFVICDNESKIVVLVLETTFTGTFKGVTVKSDKFKIGHFSNSWNCESFKPYTKTIDLNKVFQ